ncbi:hypothetical protein XAC2852_820138 [Xanthomonas citri pv. citri]|nr:hypothetical protein XAC2852_820138 [Xanthomonas citri pv. citri]
MRALPRRRRNIRCRALLRPCRHPDRHTRRALLGGGDADPQAAADVAAIAATADRQAAAGAFGAHADDDHAVGAELGGFALEALDGGVGLALGAEAGGAGRFELGDFHRADRCVGIHLHLCRVDRRARLAQHHLGAAGAAGQQGGGGRRDGHVPDQRLLVHGGPPLG